MIFVGESNDSATEGASFKKKPLELISQVDRTTTGRISGECVINATKGDPGNYFWDKLSGTRTEKGSYFLRSFSVLFVYKNTLNFVKINTYKWMFLRKKGRI